MSICGICVLLHAADPLRVGCMMLGVDHGACGAGLISVAYTNGGPVSAVWGWFGVSITNVLVALSMAEIVSAYPCAGGPYCW